MSCTTMKASGTDPASSQDRFAGTASASRASIREYSANDPAQRPMTRSPVLKPVTPAPSLATSPAPRSEEHTSELQSRLHLVCRLLLEKKKRAVSVEVHIV